jgi:hypothetical protein
MATNAYNLEGFIRVLDSWGLTDVLLPFLLIFSVIYAITYKTKIFGDRKNVSVILALVISLLVVIPHVTGVYPAGYDVVALLNAALPSVSLVIIAIVMLLILIGIFGGEASMFGMAAPTWVAVISIVIIIFIFTGAAQGWSGYGWFEKFFGSDAIAIIIMLLVFGIIISFITSADTKEDVSTLNRFGLDFKKLFGGGKD